MNSTIAHVIALAAIEDVAVANAIACELLARNVGAMRRPAGKLAQHLRAAWLWAHRAEWGNLPDVDHAAAARLFKAMQAEGLYSKKTATIDGRRSVRDNCVLARTLHRSGGLP